jgi:TRAP transporter TAXI family solute receptor
MHKKALMSCMLFTIALLVQPALGEEGVGMVTGSSTGTYIRFGQDIARIAAKEGLQLFVKESEGSLANIRRINSSENATLGIVQSDVLGFLATSKQAESRQVASRLRLIFPLYREEVHLFARKNIQRFQDLAGKRLIVGSEGSGNWLTSTNLLRITGVRPSEPLLELPPERAVTAVLEGKAEAMIFVTGRPTTSFTNLEKLQSSPEYSHLLDEVHFVPLDHEGMLKEYVVAEIGSNDYPWLNKTVPTIAVKAVLVSFDFSGRNSDYYRLRCKQLGVLGKAVREHLDELKKTGHKKWNEVNLDEELNIWKRDTCSLPVVEARPQPSGTGTFDRELCRRISGKDCN